MRVKALLPMVLPSSVLVVFAAVAFPISAWGQSLHPIVGTWQATLKDKDRKDAPRTVIVRADSSASYGEETVRWRILGKDQLWLVLGGEWVDYRFQVRGNRLTLSEGDLVEPITLTKIGPATPRPSNVAIPADPDLPIRKP